MPINSADFNLKRVRKAALAPSIMKTTYKTQLIITDGNENRDSHTWEGLNVGGKKRIKGTEGTRIKGTEERREHEGCVMGADQGTQVLWLIFLI